MLHIDSIGVHSGREQLHGPLLHDGTIREALNMHFWFWVGIICFCNSATIFVASLHAQTLRISPSPSLGSCCFIFFNCWQRFNTKKQNMWIVLSICMFVARLFCGPKGQNACSKRESAAMNMHSQEWVWSLRGKQTTLLHMDLNVVMRCTYNKCMVFHLHLICLEKFVVRCGTGGTEPFLQLSLALNHSAAAAAAGLGNIDYDSTQPWYKVCPTQHILNAWFSKCLFMIF